MTTQDRVTVAPNPVPMVEQDFTSANLPVEDHQALTIADDADFVSAGQDQDEFASFYILNVDDVLSQSELQSLRSMMKVSLHELNDQIGELSQLQKFFYSKADAAQAHVQHVKTAFECLNRTREALRQSKKELRKMEGIQRKLRLAITYS